MLKDNLLLSCLLAWSSLVSFFVCFSLQPPQITNVTIVMIACIGCSVFADKVSLLERRVCQLEKLLAPNLTVNATGIPDSISLRPDSKPVSTSTSIASSAEGVQFVPVHQRWTGRKGRQLVTWPGLQSPLLTVNRILWLAGPVSSPAWLAACSNSDDKGPNNPP